MPGRPVRIDHYQGCSTKRHLGVKIDPEMYRCLEQLAYQGELTDSELDTISRHVRLALHLYLKYKTKNTGLYRTSDEAMMKSNERSGKLFNGERY